MTASRRRQLAAAVPIAGDMLVPVCSYGLVHGILGADAVVALTTGGLAAGLRGVVRGVRDRRLAAFPLMMTALLGISVLLTFLTGDARLMLAKTAVTPVVGGLYGLASHLVGRTVLYEVITPFATGGDPDRAAAWDTAWHREPAVRRRIRLLNLLWGVGFVAAGVVRLVIVYTVPLDLAVVVSQLPMLAALAVLALVTRWLWGPLRAVLAVDRPAPRAADTAEFTRCSPVPGRGASSTG